MAVEDGGLCAGVGVPFVEFLANRVKLPTGIAILAAEPRLPAAC
jgi:hypothetical protein